ncbi:adhesin protein Mad1 [Xylaria flabelliformis]|nr:adhesin protein Mad1 [Xylaria flabelliformis]
MKNTLALVALAAGLSQVTATGFHNAPSFSCPDNSDNTCTPDMSKGFDWSDLNFGNFGSYKGFTYTGYQCSQKFGKRDELTGRSFQSKCITGKATTDKNSSPKISCDKSKGVEKTSIREFQVTPEFDCDLEFHYTMPDGSTCKHRDSCKSSGTTVKNTQCGGATDVTIVYPQQPDKPKDTCDYGIHSIGFDCEGPKPTKQHTYPVNTPTYPVNTYPVNTPTYAVSSPSSSVSTPASTPSFPPTTSGPFTFPSYTVSTPTSTPAESTPAESTPAESTPAESTPAESTPAESTPAESTPVETSSTPAESSTVGSSSTAPVSSASVTPPGSASVPGSYPVYTPPSTTSVPAESTPAESTPAQSTPAESTPAESTPAESTPAESTPAESTSAESTPAQSTPAESTPAVSTPAESTPAESTPVGSSSTAAVSTPASYSVTSYITTSTVFSTSVQTITSCGPEVTNCPAGSSAVTTTVIIPVSTTVCPVTETISQPAPTSTPVGTGSSPATYPVSSPAGSTVIASSSTSPASQTSSSPSYPVETLPCPSVVPSCLNTWMFAVGCKDNTESSCYCPDSNFVNNVFACLYAHGESDEVVSEAVSYFQGICAPFVPSNPGIVTGAETITSVLTVTPTPAPSATYTTIQVIATTVVPCTDSVGDVIPSSSSTVVISTSMTVPQVIFTTFTATGAGAGSSSVAVIPGTYPAFTPTPTNGGVAPPYPTGPAVTTFTTSPSAGYPVSTPTSSIPAIATGGASRVGAGLGFLGMMAMAVAAL